MNKILKRIYNEIEKISFLTEDRDGKFRVVELDRILSIFIKIGKEMEPDFCEWKATNPECISFTECISACGKEHISNLKTYCPYCGRKIKITK